jgi:hypothetical protein
MGLIFTILGAVSAYRLWEDQRGWAWFAIVVTLYQLSSLNEMAKERHGYFPEDKAQTNINMLASLIIIGLLVYSL